MNANELADKLNAISGHKDNDWNQFTAINKAAQMLRQQQAEIEALKEEVKKYEKHIAIQYLEGLK